MVDGLREKFLDRPERRGEMKRAVLGADGDQPLGASFPDQGAEAGIPLDRPDDDRDEFGQGIAEPVRGNQGGALVVQANERRDEERAPVDSIQRLDE